MTAVAADQPQDLFVNAVRALRPRFVGLRELCELADLFGEDLAVVHLAYLNRLAQGVFLPPLVVRPELLCFS